MQQVAAVGGKLKVFKSGNSMAIRVPKSLNLENVKELIIKKIGKNEITLTIPEQKNEWGDLISTINEIKTIGGLGIKKPETLPLVERNFGLK